MGSPVTLSVIKADVGGYVGHSRVHPEMLAKAEELLQQQRGKLLIDSTVLVCGDDIDLVMTHERGNDHPAIHQLAWDTLTAAADIAHRLKMYGAGQDLQADAFSGNVKGMGPGVAEMTFIERPSEPILIFCADKCAPGAWNLPLYKMFADPMNSPGLVIDTKMNQGATFEVFDAVEGKSLKLNTPEEVYLLLTFIGSTGRYLIKNIYMRFCNDVAATGSVQRLKDVAGRYIGKDDPVLVVRGQAGFPALGEITEAFTLGHTTAGWMRGSHQGPLMPCSFDTARPVRFDGPPRVICAGFQLAHGKLLGPVDIFDNPAFDRTRARCNAVADYLRAHGVFEPHRLHPEEMEYTTLPEVQKQVAHRWESEDKLPSKVGAGVGGDFD